MQNYYKELPEGYSEVFHLDAKTKKVSTLFTIGSFAITALAFVIILLFTRIESFDSSMDSGNYVVAYFVLLFGMIGYIILHELVHGIVYKAMTHQKLTFGFTLTVAFCGVPDIYTSRKTALYALAAPFTVFTILLIPVLAWLVDVSLQLYVALGFIFAMHLGGCIGDLYMMYVLLFRFKDERLLMNDTGPAQTLYLPE